jgi:hypothetical protein
MGSKTNTILIRPALLGAGPDELLGHLGYEKRRKIKDEPFATAGGGSIWIGAIGDCIVMYTPFACHFFDGLPDDPNDEDFAFFKSSLFRHFYDAKIVGLILDSRVDAWGYAVFRSGALIRRSYGGMVTSHNLALVREHGHGYIVGRNRRRSGEVFDYIQSATGPWIECPVGITAREKATQPKTLVQEVASKEPGVRVFVVHSEERAAFECRQRVKAMDRVRLRLEKLQRRVANGRLKVPEKIGAAAARILARNHGHRYYGWAHEDGVFRFFEHPVHFTREQAYEGKYVIQTEEQNLSAVDAVRLYKELTDVERAFADLKDVLDMRPIYHQTDNRVQAHIYVAALAFLIHRAIEKKLKAARLDLSATEALTALKSVRVVDIDLGDGTTKRSVTAGTNRAATVLRALGIEEINPPTPPRQGETVM